MLLYWLTPVYPVMTRLYKERLCQVDIKLQEVIAACAQEYLEPLANLQENMQIRTKVGGEFPCHIAYTRLETNVRLCI